MDIISEFEAGVVSAVSDGSYDNDFAAQREHWNYISALFYCVTVITTIGYGHIVPRTFNGKISTILYSVLGIPLFLLTLTNLGNSMATAFRFAYTKLCCCCVKKEERETLTAPTEADPNEPQPYIPYPKYTPKRKGMLISPPISATIHRGDDLLHLPVIEEKPTNKSSTAKKKHSRHHSHKVNPIRLDPQALEAQKMVAECMAYASSNCPGFKADPVDLGILGEKELQQSQSFPSKIDHDYDYVTDRIVFNVEPSASTTTSPPESMPSSPALRDNSSDRFVYASEPPIRLTVNDGLDDVISMSSTSTRQDGAFLDVNRSDQFHRRRE